MEMINMPSQQLQELFIRYYSNTATEEEVSELMTLLKSQPDDAAVNEWLDNEWKTLTVADPLFAKQEGQHLLNRILGEKRPATVRPMYKWAAAAAVVLAIGTGTFLLTRQKTKVQRIAAITSPVMPGSNKAVLTLADGTKVTLDSAGRQQLVQGSTTISQQNGSLEYAAGSHNNQLSYNTLSTPRGGQFRLTLPDGTQVWLNAASSITYPTAFNGNDRHIKLSGEAYFEVASDPQRPFHVTINNSTELAVLGTHFDICAYTDEPYAYATLLEGSVKVANTNGGPEVQLRPGQQAQTNGNTTLTVNDNINTDQVLAWKNGTFDFNNNDLPTILRQLARWYDVDIVYEGKVPDRRFGGEMQRSLQLQQVLRILETMDVKFKVEEHKLIVQP